jgi:Ca2+-binding RTX toxin-like protein
VGGEGDDLLLGGAGDDTLVFEPFSGNDTVGDFAAGAGSEDLLDLRGRGFTDAANVMENATQDGGDVVIDLGNGDSVRLVGTELSALHADDFLV